MAYGIPFNELSNLTEGQQADEYKARKAKEAEDEKKKEDDRYYRRNNSITGGNYPLYYGNANAERDNLANKSTEDTIKYVNNLMNYADKHHKNPNTLDSEFYDKYMASRKAITGKSPDFDEKDMVAQDAYHRHMRRHPKNESSIFESVEIL